MFEKYLNEEKKVELVYYGTYVSGYGSMGGLVTGLAMANIPLALSSMGTGLALTLLFGNYYDKNVIGGQPL